MLTYKQKHDQANREAIATVVALIITIAVWAVCGFGLSGTDITVLHTPLWIIGGTLGTWLCAIVVSVVLAKRFFVDFDLDDECMTGSATNPTVPETTSCAPEQQGGSNE